MDETQQPGASDVGVLYTVEGEVPEESYVIPFAEANVVREGSDVTMVALGRMVHFAEQAAEELQREDGISCEIVDPRTTSPLDVDTILESVENTGRLVVVGEASPRCGMACDIVARVAQEAFADLKAPPRMVTPPHTPVPFSPTLEDAYVPSPERIADAVREVAGAATASEPQEYIHAATSYPERIDHARAHNAASPQRLAFNPGEPGRLRPHPDRLSKHVCPGGHGA